MSTDATEALDRIRAQALIRRMKAATEEPVPCDDCPPDTPETPVTAASDTDIPIHGVAVPYDIATGDGRKVRAGALSWDLTTEGVPIIWDPDNGDHSGMVLGRVDTFMDDGGAVLTEARLFGFPDDEDMQAFVARVVQLIEENAVGWSVMLDDEVIEATYKEPVVIDNGDGTTTVKYAMSDDMSEVVSARIRHLAIVDTPAFPGARPVLGPLPVNAAAAYAAVYPATAFERWESDDMVPLRVTPDGRVWGHAAGDGCYRTGLKAGRCDKYTRDPDPNMVNFHTGTVTLDNGNVIRAGNLTCAGLHASVSMSHAQQRRHHEDSTTVWAKVVAWNDRKGRLCVSGSLVPGLDPTFTAQVAGLPISPELWPVPGVRGLTLVGAHSVITPAWPVN